MSLSLDTLECWVPFESEPVPCVAGIDDLATACAWQLHSPATILHARHRLSQLLLLPVRVSAG